jgi:hypothetical protein
MIDPAIDVPFADIGHIKLHSDTKYKTCRSFAPAHLVEANFITLFIKLQDMPELRSGSYGRSIVHSVYSTELTKI